MSAARLLRAIREELVDFPLWLLRNLPGRGGTLLRRLYWKRRLRHLGRGVVFGRNVSIQTPSAVSIGDGCWIDENVTLIAGAPPETPHMKRLVADPEVPEGDLLIGDRCHLAVDVVVQAHGGVRIGEETGVAGGSRIYSLSHHYRNLDDRSDEGRYIFGPLVEPERQFLLVGPVVLERATAVGLNSVVLPGSRLRAYSWLGSGSVLSGESPEGAILGGNPARVLKLRPGFAERSDAQGGAESPAGA
jgi:acetyltransferase-like isoleucine patch superfamily enzyme